MPVQPLAYFFQNRNGLLPPQRRALLPVHLPIPHPLFQSVKHLHAFQYMAGHFLIVLQRVGEFSMCVRHTKSQYNMGMGGKQAFIDLVAVRLDVSAPPSTCFPIIFCPIALHKKRSLWTKEKRWPS